MCVCVCVCVCVFFFLGLVHVILSVREQTHSYMVVNFIWHIGVIQHKLKTRMSQHVHVISVILIH